MKKKNGFTLAEVLITLAIIGVVAALTIPSVITNYRKNLYVTQLKKEYNYITNAFRTAMARDGVTKLDNTKLWTSITNTSLTAANLQSNSEAYNEFSKIFNVTKIYDGNTNKIPGVNSSYNVLVYKFLDGRDYYNGWNGISNGVCLADGACFQFTFNKNSDAEYCQYPHKCGSLKEFQEYHNVPTRYWERAGSITIDVNGFLKGPNQTGRDYFCFGIGNDGALYPCGGIDEAVKSGSTPYAGVNTAGTYWRYNDSARCNPGSSDSGNGSTCTARIMEEGWKMNY